ncbi:hypothetical protein HDU77_009537 [Chytriomyces hyalinus]|nr:hypothetical protein HDU77_009537 [Chytriomyces hyalinus]
MSYLDSERVQEIRILSFMWASVYFSSVIFLLVFTICVDLPRRGTPVSLKTTFTTSYSLLLGAHALSMSYQIFKGFSLESGNHVFLVAAAFSFGVSGAMYLSSDILKNQYNARMYRIFFTLLWLCPFTSMLPALAKFSTFSLPAAESEKYNNVAQFVSGGVVTILDGFFAWAFYSYLMKNARPASSNDVPCVNRNGTPLKIIAQYGLIASCFCFLGLTGFVSLTAVLFLDANLASPSLWGVYLLGAITVDFGAAAALVTLIIMKVRLHLVWIEENCIREAVIKAGSIPNADSGGVLTMQKTLLSLKQTDSSPSLVVSV